MIFGISWYNVNIVGIRSQDSNPDKWYFQPQMISVDLFWGTRHQVPISPFSTLKSTALLIFRGSVENHPLLRTGELSWFLHKLRSLLGHSECTSYCWERSPSYPPVLKHMVCWKIPIHFKGDFPASDGSSCRMVNPCTCVLIWFQFVPSLVDERIITSFSCFLLPLHVGHILNLIIL